MTVGLLGGTFDPIHVGHLDVARAARAALGLEAVWLVPARTPPHRRRPKASAAHRFALTALATQAETAVLVSDVEMDADGPSYTAATLDRLESRGWDLRRFCFIIGADAFREIESWKDYPRVLDRCDFAVVSRRGLPASDLRRVLPSLAGRMMEATIPPPGFAPAQPTASRGASSVQASILLIDAPTSPISSTDVRQAIAAGAPLAGLVAPPVADYIARHGLYRHDPEGHESGKEPHEDTATPAS
jgi:nicotinate-nucleotide adenylyltransferase